MTKSRSAPNTPSTKPKVIKAERHLAIATYSGPLPDPATFEAYDHTTPGAGERILAMAEKEQAHRHKMEALMTEAYAKDSVNERKEIQRSQWMAWTLASGVVLIGGFLVYAGHSVVGTLLTGGTLIGIVSAFLEKNRHEKDNNDELHHRHSEK